MVAFLWDQVKKLSEKARQHSGEVQVGYSDMCKLENAGSIPHLRKEPEPDVEVYEEVINETVVEQPPVVLIVKEEPIPEPVPEPAPEPKPEVTEINELLEQYKQKLLSKKNE